MVIIGINYNVISHEKFIKEDVNVCSALIDFFSYDSGFVICVINFFIILKFCNWYWCK